MQEGNPKEQQNRSVEQQKKNKPLSILNRAVSVPKTDAVSQGEGGRLDVQQQQNAAQNLRGNPVSKENQVGNQKTAKPKSWFETVQALTRKYWVGKRDDVSRARAHEKGLPYFKRPMGILGKRDLTTALHWTDFEGPIKRPCVIVLGGDDTINQEEANGVAKRIEQLLGIVDVPEEKRSFDVLSAIYVKAGRTDLDRRLFAMKHGNVGLSERLDAFKNSGYKRSLSMNPEYCQDLYKKIFLPLISTNEGKERRPLDQVAKSLRRINLVAHCHGTFVAMEMQDLMERDLIRLNYSKKEQEYLFSQISLVGFAPSELPYGHSKMNTMYFASLSDENFALAQEDKSSVPGLLVQKTSGQDEVPNFVVSLKQKNENLYVSKQIGKDVDTSFQPDHMLTYYTGPWRMAKVTEAGRKMTWVSALTLKANLSESLQAEGQEKLTPRANGITKILTPIQYQEGPHKQKGAHKSGCMVNILSTRISDDDKKKLMVQALQNGVPYQRVLDRSDVVWCPPKGNREEEATHIMSLPKADRKAALTLFHVMNPSERTAMRFQSELLDKMDADYKRQIESLKKSR